MQIAKAFTHQQSFLTTVRNVLGVLPTGVVDIIPSLGTDWNGEAAVFFEVVLADGVPRADLLGLTKEISQAIVQRVQPLEEWGVLPYFDFRTESEQARIQEPTLA